LLIVLLAGVSAKTLWYQLDGYTWEDYKIEFSKRYSDPQEHEARRAIFEAQLKKIRLHNQDTTKTWKEGVNHMTDWTHAEFMRLMGGKPDYARVESRIPHIQTYDAPAASSVDWRTKGVVTAVKDQGQCGSCWTFGTAETIESHNAITNGILDVLSEQQILDCVPNPQQCGGTGGCGGGTPELAYAGIIKAGGIASEWTYPYVSWSGNNFTCPAALPSFEVFLLDYKVLPSNQLKPILDAVTNIGPLAVNLDASTWQNYESGVYNGCNLNTSDIDHVVQLVGYDTDPNTKQDFWIVRNSWTPYWGEKGYIRLPRYSSCSIDNTPGDGTGCSGGPAQVTTCGACGIFYDVSYPIIKKR
jgi:cathepsin L